MKLINTKNFKNNSLYLLIVLISLLFNSILLDKICLCIIILNIVKIGRNQLSFFNPYYLFLPVPISLLFTFNVSDNYNLDLTHKTYLLAILHITVFLSGLNFLSLNKRVISSLRKKLNDTTKSINKKMALFIIVFFMFLSYLAQEIIILSSILWIFSIPAIVLSFKTKNIFYILSIISLLTLQVFIFSSKMQLLLYLITIIISIEKFYTFKSITLYTTVFLSFVFLIYSFSFANKERGNYDSEIGLDYYTSQGAEWSSEATLFLPYMYLTSSWTNLQYVVESQNTRTYGLWCLKPFINYFQIDELFYKEYKLIPYSSFNTFTFIAVFFKDFGFFLSVLPTFFISLLIKKVYNNFLLTRNSFEIAVYCIFALATVEMFFSNHFFMLSYPFSILILSIVLKRIKSIWRFL